ncbi:MAG: PAS domain-containing protein [Myxococcales bacterium]|nr:PAS domain-containing protein [Myxococcales bacterium]
MSHSFPPSPSAPPRGERHSSIDGLPIASMVVDRLFRQSLLVLLGMGVFALLIAGAEHLVATVRPLFVMQALFLLVSALLALSLQFRSAMLASKIVSFGVLASVSLSLHGSSDAGAWQFLTVVPMLLLGLQYGRRGVTLSALVVMGASLYFALVSQRDGGKPWSWLLGLQLVSRAMVVAMGALVIDRLLAIIREREAFLIDVFRDIDIGVSVFDVDEQGELRVAALNPRVYQLLGLPKGPLLGRRHRDVLPREQLRTTDPMLHRALSTKEIQHNEDRGFSGDQHQRVLLTAVPQCGEDQQVRRLVVSGTDITQLKDAERKLRSQAEVLANVADAVIAVDGSFQITYANRATERLFRVDAQRVMGARLDLVTGDAFLRELERHVGQAEGVQTGSFVVGDKQEIPLEYTISTQLDEDGRVSQHLVVIRDIRDRRSLEAQLLRAQKTEALGRLAGGIAHDFNNMLVVISGNAELLAESLSSDHPGQEDLKEIRQAAARAADLVRQLLTFSRRQHGVPRECDLNQILGDMKPLILRLLGKGIELSINLSEGLGAVMVDVGQLEQVMVQLLLNARDAIPSQGQIEISTRNVTLGEESAQHGLLPGDYVEIKVADSGVGMSQETMKRLFEPFFSTKSASRTVGLGLSVCYGIIRQYRGAISAESKLGEGSIFVVWLPHATKSQRGLPLPSTLQNSNPETEAVMAEFSQSRPSIDEPAADSK